MRYIVAIGTAGIVVLLFHLMFGFGSLPRPWGSLVLGSIAGITMVAILYVWELRKPSEDPEERDKRLRIEEAAKAEARELRRAQKRDGSWYRTVDGTPHADGPDSSTSRVDRSGPAEGSGETGPDET